MLTVTFKSDEFILEGHADFDEYGKDIVCSAVSFLAQAVTYELDTYVHTSHKIESGYLSVKLYTLNTEAYTLMQLLKNGVAQIAKQFPNNVQIKEEIN